MRLGLALALSLLPTVATAQPAVEKVAHAEPKRPADATARGKKLRVPMMALENGLMVGIPAWDYWHTVELQKEDWDLNWSWATWRTKLITTDAWVMDTNRFEPNAIRHPLAGAMTYQIGRANGLGPVGSTIMNAAASWLWENVGEFRERPAINDLFCNTIGGLLVGEPLFQIGTLADGHGGLMRRAVGFATSPFSRMQKELGISPLADEIAPAHRIEMSAGTDVVQHEGDRPQGEARINLDVEMMKDKNFAMPGAGASWTGLGGWDRMAVDVKVGGKEATGIDGYRFRSFISYTGRYSRDLDEDSHGSATFVGVGGAFQLQSRNLPAEVDRFAVISLINPRVGGWVHTDHAEVDWEAGASADVAMVQAHALAGMPLMQDSSILATRGYYYATGASASARVRARAGRWNAELEGTAHQMWSFDDHSYGGDMDPKNVQDQRVVTKAVIGVKPTSKDVRIELYSDAILRRGTWSNVERHTSELAAGLALTAGF